LAVAALGVVLLLAPLSRIGAAAEGPLPIERVEISANRVFEVNGAPFFPLMSWLQDAENFPDVKACGMNTTAGYWPGSSETKDVTEYLGLVQKAGLYGVMPFDPQLKAHPYLLGYIHDDEPDLPRQVSDAETVPGAGLRINRKTPLWKLVDGVTHTWSVLDPLENTSVTIRLKRPVTVESIALWLTVSKGISVAKDVSLDGDGKEILKATLEAKRGQQKFDLAKPATFKELTLRVHSIVPGDAAWGSIGEIEAFDAAGKNALLSPPRYEPRAQPSETLDKYKRIKAADPSRPIFLTVTGNFHPHFKKWTDVQRRSLYSEYIKATDVVGYDIYPIYGWNKPEWIHLVSESTGLLVEHAGQRPVYAWIETSKGGQWTGALERQKDVTPTHIRAEVWMAICRGATAIGYFTHVWKPSYRQFGVPQANRKALREINDQITRLAPAILGERPEQAVTVKVEGDVKLDIMAKEHDGQIFVFAVNYDERVVGTKATISVPGLQVGKGVDVVDESRTLRAGAGEFVDTFEPLAVHIYSVSRQR